jgi:hypothetical protein
MATRVHRHLKAVAFNANGIVKKHSELIKQLQDHHTDLALILDIHLKPHERFFFPNYHIYWTDCSPGLNRGTAPGTH